MARKTTTATRRERAAATTPSAPPTPAATAPDLDVTAPKRPRGRPKLAPGESKAKPKSEHNAAYRAKGKQVATVLTNPDALAVLAAETAKGRTVAEVIEWALIEADRARPA